MCLGNYQEMAQIKGGFANKATVLYDSDSLTAQFLGTDLKRCLYKIAVLLLKWDLSFFLQHMPQIPSKADDELVRTRICLALLGRPVCHLSLPPSVHLGHLEAVDTWFALSSFFIFISLPENSDNSAGVFF